MFSSRSKNGVYPQWCRRRQFLRRSSIHRMIKRKRGGTKREKIERRKGKKVT